MSNLYPGSSQIPAMLVSKCPKDWQEKLKSHEYIGNEKKDGFFYQLERTADGDVYLFSRSKSKKTGELTEKIANVPHIQAFAEQFMPLDSIIIGEVYYPGKTSKDVTKIMGSLPAKAIQRQFDTEEFGGPIHYYIHDIIRWDKKDLTDIPYNDRIEYVRNLECDCNDMDYIEFAKRYTNNLENILQKIFEDGGEGMVFRKKDSVYQPGKRPKDIFKIKTEETIDAVIMGFVDPVKEYTGTELDTWKYWIDGEPVTKAYYHRWRAGFVVGVYNSQGELVPIGNITSGMTDYMRETASDFPAQYLNHVIEIQCMSVDPVEQTIRHGRFLRMRDDKNLEDCTIDSVFG